MTGFGEAHVQEDGLAVAVEVRTINNRFFKLSVRTTEGYAALEPLVEDEVRAAVHRGTIQVNVRVDRRRSPDDYRINVDVLDRYRQQLETLRQQWQVSEPVSFEALLPLPGVVDDAAAVAVDAAADWPVMQRTLQAALENFGRMRGEEGRAMAADLTANCRLAAASLDQIERRAPWWSKTTAPGSSTGSSERWPNWTSRSIPADVIKEVSLFADRSDISEEIVRLRSHLEQFQASMELPRKLPAGSSIS